MKYYSTTETVNEMILHITEKKPNFYIRFGDGDFNLMKGESEMLASFSQEIQHSYERLLTHYLNENHMISINYHCKKLNTLEKGMEPGVHEYPDEAVFQNSQIIKHYLPRLDKMYSHVALHHVLVHDPDLYTHLLKAIQKNISTIIIANKLFDPKKLQFYFGNHSFIGGNANESFAERERIWAEFESIVTELKDYTVCILALGCGGRAMSYKMLEVIDKHKKDVFLLDIGSSIDVLMGYNTRAWIDILKPNVDVINELLIEEMV